MVTKSFEQVINDPRIGEIVISSDADEGEQWEQLQEYCKYQPKIKLVRNNERLGVYGNKHASVKAASFEYVIIFDSDNILSKEYIDGVYTNSWSPDKIIAPSFARPTFDYRAYQDMTITRANVHSFIGKKGIDCLLNTMNYFCNKETYLSAWEPKEGVKGQDSIFMNYLLLKKGASIYVCGDVQYEHLIHKGSYYQEVAEYSAPLAKQIENDLKNMR